MPEQMDIAPKELGLLQEKIRRTNALKLEYLRNAHNPYRHATGEGGFVVGFCPLILNFTEHLLCSTFLLVLIYNDVQEDQK